MNPNISIENISFEEEGTTTALLVVTEIVTPTNISIHKHL